jgi:transcription initiation factor TFIIIB Brf1 subunit/transcription initiation factor TFIIB
VFIRDDGVGAGVYRASDEVENEQWLRDLEAAADRLALGEDARSRAMDLFLSTVPDADRSKQATLAASLYVGGLVAGDRRSQGAVADAVGVSRLSVQQRWKDLLEEAGLEAPSW